MNMGLLQNQIVVITGGAGTLGESFSRAVVENGAKLIIADRDLEKANCLSELLNTEFGADSVQAMEVDICSSVSVDQMFQEVMNKYGRFDALVNNAYPRNKNYGRDFFDVTFEDFCENLSINLGGYFLCCQKAAEYFAVIGQGNIINISSIYGIMPPRFHIYDGTSMTMPVEYAAIKSALIHMTKFMAKRFKGMNIRVNALSPGGILDAQSENFIEAYNAQCLNKGMLNPTDINGALLYLLSNMSLNCNGQNLVIDDGFSL